MKYCVISTSQTGIATKPMRRKFFDTLEGAEMYARDLLISRRKTSPNSTGSLFIVKVVQVVEIVEEPPPISTRPAAPRDFLES